MKYLWAPWETYSTKLTQIRYKCDDFSYIYSLLNMKTFIDTFWARESPREADISNLQMFNIEFGKCK